ncbi:rab-GTPase-TBC domain-containing protein [Chytriomyces sp. MP71]|nr:rab-GTPase-TBC domain-containing protein [Chytriomyces sp. MP71]
MLLSSEEAEQLMSEYDSASLYLGAFADSLHTRVARARLYQRRPAASDGALDTSREFEALRARWGGLPARTLGRRVEGEEWVLLFDERGRITLGEEAVREMLYARGVSGECRREVWKFLLDVYTWDGEEVERVQSLRVRRAQYESLRRQWVGILEMAGAAAEFEQVASPVKGLPLGSGFGGVGADANTAVGDEKIEGDVVSKIKERKARVEKDVVRTDRGVPFFQGSPDDNNILLISPTSPRFKTAHLSTNLEALKNVLMTYTLYNFDLGYVQGMNDLCSPILAVMDGDEVEAFWSFVGFMEKRKGNFSRDQSGMHGQLKSLEMLIRFVDPFLWLHLDRIDSTNLFCCFRWILIVFKREFKFEQILTLWEAMWACPFTKNFHIFVALAILNKHRSAIMKTCTAFDEALKFVNDLSETHDVEDIIQRAEVLFRVFQQQLTQAMREQEGIDMATGAAVVPSPIATEGKLHAGGEGRGLSPASSRAALTADTREGGKSLSRASSRSTVGDNGVRGVSPSPQGVGVFTLDQLIELAELLEKE